MSLIVGIDASNIRRGGGVTHLVELLLAAHRGKIQFSSIVIWAGQSTLAAIEDHTSIRKCNPPALDQGLIQRTSWQLFSLSQAVRDAGCNVLFVPGGSYCGDFHPVVTMNQNLLPFELLELKRYGLTLTTLRFFLLRIIQSCSYRRSDGVIFLTNYAHNQVTRVTGPLRGKISIIPHGLNLRFIQEPKPQREIQYYSVENPLRLLYVSTIDQYKHQWHVVKAVSILRREGFPIELDLVGPAYPPALKRLNATITLLDPKRDWVHYCSAIPYSEIHEKYAMSDIAIWASTCETFGIILLEAMAAGLPIACSNKQPMPEVVGRASVFFDPEQPNDIACALRQLINSPRLRAEFAYRSYQKAQEFSWERCADETFKYLASIAQI